MKWLFISGTILFICYFIFSGSYSNDQLPLYVYQSPRYVKLADEITEKTANGLEEQKNLYLTGTGGRMMHDIQMMAMSFNYYQEVSLNTARKMIVYAVDQYLSAINSNQEIRSHLHEYPFKAENVEIVIFVYNPDKSELPLDKIYHITSSKGIIKYYTRANTRQAIFQESYEEAHEK